MGWSNVVGLAVGESPVDAPIQLVVVSVGGLALWALLVLGLVWVATVLGHGYRQLSAEQYTQLRGATLYHYCDDAAVENVYDTAAGMVTLKARGRALVPFLTGRRAVFFYVGHGPRGGRFNHPTTWRSCAAIFQVSADEVLRRAGSPKALMYRRWDAALAVVGSYDGPALLCARQVDIIAVKNSEAAPTPREAPGKPSVEGHA